MQKSNPLQRWRSIFPVLLLLLFLSQKVYAQQSGLPCLSVDAGLLAQAKQHILSGGSQYADELKILRDAAENALRQKPVSVMDKKEMPPDGDKHDFMCPAPLWWPDPDQPDGLPYVWNRKGEINPEYFQIGDWVAWDRMARATSTLGLAYYFTGEDKYAEHAAKLLRTWFIEPDTKMNPNLNHAWFERGRNDGTYFGVMATQDLPQVLDAAVLLQASSAWRAEDHGALQEWARGLLHWFKSTELGFDASLAWNHKGTAHDVQIVALASFVGDSLLAKETINYHTRRRIDRHIRPQGHQPYEIEREIPFYNSTMNLGFFFMLATMADAYGIDLWHFRAPEGGSLGRALDYVAPYADPQKVWPHPYEVRREYLRPLLRQAAIAYDDESYLRLARMLADTPVDAYHLPYLFYPKTAPTQLGSSLISVNSEALERTRERIKNDDKFFDKTIAFLIKEADEALDLPAYSVLDKPLTPPSGNKHDYMSVGGYYWPDPDTPDGLPYIFRDGKVNPDARSAGDWNRYEAMNLAVQSLGLAYYFTLEEKYAAQTARLVRTWFLDPATKMNPHVKYSHAWPGIVEGSYYGIIETRYLPATLDAIGMLQGSEAWSAADAAAMQDWCSEFLEWMLHDEPAPEAGKVWNNHSTNYFVTAVSFALFAGKYGLARDLLEQTKVKLVQRQIRPDGRIPFELERNRAWTYSAATLDGYCKLAHMGTHVGVDLWHYQGPARSSLRKALLYLAPYVDPANTWPYADLDFQKRGNEVLAWAQILFTQAESAYDDKPFAEAMTHLDFGVENEVMQKRGIIYLLYSSN